MTTTRKKTGTVKAVKKTASVGVAKKTTSAKVAKKIASKSVPKKTRLTKTRAKKKDAPSGPLVSVVMPAHNAADFIDDTIHSVLGQSYENWELIIVDDHSTDKTLEVVRQFKCEKIKVIALARNTGVTKARNRGVSAARGRYICFLDADDLWQPSKLKHQVEFMKEKDCAFSFTSYVFADAKGRPNGKVVRVPSEITYRQALRNTTIWTSTVMLDMKKLSKKDLKMPDVKSEDLAPWCKVLEKVDFAFGMKEVTVIRGYEAGISFWKKMMRGVR